jgi:hypothetical protein
MLTMKIIKLELITCNPQGSLIFDMEERRKQNCFFSTTRFFLLASNIYICSVSIFDLKIDMIPFFCPLILVKNRTKVNNIEQKFLIYDNLYRMICY